MLLGLPLYFSLSGSRLFCCITLEFSRRISGRLDSHKFIVLKCNLLNKRIAPSYSTYILPFLAHNI
ncbi:hypothetical protein BAZSYMB_GCONTIG00625_2 [Bathymodiolus azoricus thioautotrophic gill symbiont]|uniref:Uncharacterized protein n=1 Tax=Bathymodiolus azoricus thioautotrophic gill symbiont TaxID=235205 RepID=A0A1H6LWS4_9GAMM|nr:hypothetical protein BAZSYMB_GCONTIG00625_2 [Bathymodiolus azoricus thioautotrophic gill symbiont]